MDRQTDMTELIVSFHNFANALKIFALGQIHYWLYSFWTSYFHSHM